VGNSSKSEGGGGGGWGGGGGGGGRKGSSMEKASIPWGKEGAVSGRLGPGAGNLFILFRQKKKGQNLLEVLPENS